MGTALLSGIIHSNLVHPTDIMVWDVLSQKTEDIKKQYKVVAASQMKDMFDLPRMIFLAVKPADMPQVLDHIRDFLKDDHLIISVAAGISIDQIIKVVGTDQKVIRLMPNTPCLISMGMTVVSPGNNVAENELSFVMKLMEALGKVVILEEKLMDAATGLSGSGPAYVFMFVEALADGGVKMGLPRDKALLLAAQTVSGAAEMVIQSGEHPSTLKDRVASPGGTTIEGIYALEKKSFRGTIMKAVEAAVKRAGELGKEREG
ncbi:pyrroline-5-carboxylate reductase [Candidatus Contubernalis alkalaceticus]|nr:pyrroline-5-carboxylate reductase [Candidatus Contubernalis alkalaceticus]